MNIKDDHLRVKIFETNQVVIEIVDFDKWQAKNSSDEIKIGSILKIEDGDSNNILCLVKSFKMIEDKSNENEAFEMSNYEGTFLIFTQPIGRLYNGDFKKGLADVSIPPTGISLASIEDLQAIYCKTTHNEFIFSEHRNFENIDIIADGNEFFSKHLAVVGTTGSGKSCTVAKLIQELKIENEKKNNTHVIIFDIHGEYRRAFPNSKHLSIEDETLDLPYWLFNSEELETLFIESSDLNAYNQISQFKYAVIENKKWHNSSLKNITYDTPVYFDINEVYCYLHNKNYETHFVKEEVEYFATNISDQKAFIESNNLDSMWQKMTFEKSTGNSKHKNIGEKVFKAGGFTGEFERFVSRINMKLTDERLNFIFKQNEELTSINSHELLVNVVKKLIGYESETNVTVIDLSSIPFEIVSIVVSIVSRIIFDFCYQKNKVNGTNDTPYLLVYEEAHKYVPKTQEVKYRNARKSVERIAKEGRKYGVSAMIVSQRPSELSSTVFSQCNNFVIMRLTNPDDQNYVKNLLPDASISYGDELSSLDQREALVVGEAFSTPTIVRIKEAKPVPQSNDIDFYSLWSENWKDINFSKLFSLN